MQECTAHISDDKARRQSVEEHNRNVAALAASFAAKFGMEKEAYQTGLFHDIGKTSKEFQDHILKDGPKCEHASAGAYELGKAGDLAGSMCVLGHHTGLTDFGTPADSETTYTARIKKAKEGLIPAYHTPEYALRSDIPLHCKGEEAFSDSFKVRMLYSCLVDADFLDTESFMKEKAREYSYDGMDSLLHSFHAYISKWNHPETLLNRKRQDILDNCLTKGKEVPSGLYSLTVPTGGGKTTASLGFALEHAKAQQKDRIIYVIPYTSIIEQNARIFRDILGAGNVLEHHCGYDGAEGNTQDDFAKELLASENWDAPVIVTTAVRFFEALYSEKPSRCRRLHNIANSVVIFDEAQLLPVNNLLPCVRAIGELVKNFGVTALLCTATSPALDGFFQEQGLCVKELQPDQEELYEILRRTRLEVEKDKKYSPADIAAEMSRKKQVLCIVNTRKAAKDVYDALPKEGRYHLSTLMYPAHRSAVLSEVKERLKNKETVRLVSTSLVEAGVDIDFPYVMREKAGLDSVLQAAGRCNREGNYPAEESIVSVFTRDEKAPYLFRRNIGAWEMTVRRYDEPDSRDAVDAYFKELYRFTGTDGLDADRIIAMIEKAQPCPFPFKQVAGAFRMIHDNTRTVYIKTEESLPYLGEIMDGCADRYTYRMLGQYGVSVMDKQFDTLVKEGFVLPAGADAGILLDSTLYSMETGLSLSRASRADGTDRFVPPAEIPA